MKKSLIFGLMLALAVGLSACGDKGSLNREEDHEYFDKIFKHEGLIYLIFNHNSVLVHGTSDLSGKLVIPSKVKYEGSTYYVVGIGANAFTNCYGLTSVKIPSTVKGIGRGAFSGCRELTSVRIPKGVTEISSDAFYGCSSLTSVRIPKGVTKISPEAFYNCGELTSVRIPKGVTEIGIAGA